MPDYSDQNLAVTQAWDRKMRQEEAAEQRDEERRERMQTRPHRWRGTFLGQLYCEDCGIHRDHHGQGWA